MKADDLILEELIEFSEGYISLHGRRLVLHDSHSFGELQKQLKDLIGEEQTRSLMTRFGFYWGQADAAAMKRIFKWRNTIEWLKASSKMQRLAGVAKTEIQSLSFDENKGLFEMTMIWQNSNTAEEYLNEFDKTDHPVCSILMGYASGYASFCTGCDIYFIEEKCIAKGDKICTATGKDAKSWGEKLKPNLQFFESFEIENKVKKLTIELSRKKKELTKKKEELNRYRNARELGFFEGNSPSFQKVVKIAQKVAKFDSSLLITGETGTGKEVIARYTHKLSHSSNGPFLAINCSALPDNLLESELFGHKKGSFTGAIKDHKGLFEEADKGTIFLDEIADTTPALQTKLLRVLQNKEIIPVGSTKSTEINVRIIAATHKKLKQEVSTGKFREDLYFRLCVVEIVIPPLRERQEDILHLARFFIKRFAEKLNISKLRLDASCLDYFLDYEWPGNVRELENAIEHASIFAKDGLILPDCLPSSIVQSTFSKHKSKFSSLKSLDEVEADYIKYVLDKENGNKTKAMEILGLSRATLWRKLKQTNPDDK